ncbi:Glutaredoxin domain-containing protein [Heracleum sosnowskyi]|uniref:Glutaredoxin domain-containing protein n=1 Tax=Heracleum sosnowskyi TaxID=360622 RepID=A0AAD8HF25_9APIA|nr:Glutaredoxin domain-containing protein [Heracleum sosnowskyi]
MGCSASRSNTLLTSHNADHQEKPTNLSPSSSSNSSSFSNSDSFFYQNTPISRTISLPTPLIHHPPLKKGDTNHLVSLTSTTYGSLILVDPVSDPDCDPSSSPDSVINTWELMEGLDEVDFDGAQNPKGNSCNNGGMGLFCSGSDYLNSFEVVEHKDSKPLWKHLSEESMLAKMDSNVVSSYRRALVSRQLGYSKDSSFTKDFSFAKDSSFKEIEELDVKPAKLAVSDSMFYLSGCEDKIVLYFTSLRGIRKTYEDCCQVRMILKGFKVFVDERDISMDSEYRKELENLFEGKKGSSLPKVFIRGKCIGGAEEIKQLNEDGELGKLLEGFPVKDLGLVCEGCGDARFVLCPNCNGSRKVFEEEDGGLRRCPGCNENGLIRCPGCCS